MALLLINRREILAGNKALSCIRLIRSRDEIDLSVAGFLGFRVQGGNNGVDAVFFKDFDESIDIFVVYLEKGRSTWEGGNLKDIISACIQ